MSEFKIVQSKKNRKTRGKSSKLIDRDVSPVEVNTEKFVKQIRNCELELQSSDFFQSAISSLSNLSLLKQVQEIVCLGIGRIAECPIAKHQLAFISLTAKQFEIKTIKFFDPILSPSENQLIVELGHNVLSENKEGKHEAKCPTLFYLPHCPKQIINNLLYANWNPESLRNLLLICNSFRTIIDTTPERLLRPNGHYILEAASFSIEKEIENSFKFTDIFNDFSIISFNPTQTPKELWENHQEPIYLEEDLELVTNGSSKDTSGSLA